VPRRDEAATLEGMETMAGGNLWSFIWTMAVFIVTVCVMVFALVWLFQGRLIYFPTQTLDATPTEIDLSYEDVRFKGEDGLALSGWFIPAERARGTILFCHGNAGNISHRLDSIAIFHRLGMHTFIFDYRGYGRSDGRPGEEGTYRDALAAWRFLVEKRHIPPEEIVIFGRSLGGAVAAWLAGRQTPGALILESTFTSIEDIASNLYPYLPVRHITRFGYHTTRTIATVRCPVLIAHSRDDDIIPFAHGEKIFQTAGEPKVFLEMAGSHNEGFMMTGAAYVEGLNAFLIHYFDDTVTGAFEPDPSGRRDIE